MPSTIASGHFQCRSWSRQRWMRKSWATEIKQKQREMTSFALTSRVCAFCDVTWRTAWSNQGTRRGWPCCRGSYPRRPGRTEHPSGSSLGRKVSLDEFLGYFMQFFQWRHKTRIRDVSAHDVITSCFCFFSLSLSFFSSVAASVNSCTEVSTRQ